MPDPDVVEVLGLLGERGARRVLDVGCSPGRDALLLAGHGLETHAVDLAAAGLDHLREEARLRGLDVAACPAAMTDLPYPNASFDYVLAFNVVCHGEPAVVRRAIAEIRRVFRPRGSTRARC